MTKTLRDASGADVNAEFGSFSGSGIAAADSGILALSADSSDYTSLTWVCTWYFFLMLVILTLLPALGLSSKLRSVVALTNRGSLFFLAVLVAWLGIDCNQYARYHRYVRSQHASWL